MDSLVWIDVETTGLSPKEDDLLEVGAIITDSNLEIRSAFQGILRSSDIGSLNWNEFTHAMHSNNGLISDLSKQTMTEEKHLYSDCTIISPMLHYGIYDSSDTLEDDLGKWFASTYKRMTGERAFLKLPLAGSNPGFDRSWLEEFMPTFSNNCLHYRSFDVNTLHYFLESYKVKSNRPHRALDDLLQDINYVQSERKKYKENSEKSWMYDELG